MKRFSILFVVVIFSGILMAQENDEDLIKKTIINAYQDGLLNEGDDAKVDAGFHPDFEMLGVDKNGQMYRYHINDWKASNKKKLDDGRLPKKEGDKVKIKIPMVDVTGIAAVAKIEFYVKDKLTFVDYQSLYKLDGKWKIVAKIYHTVE